MEQARARAPNYVLLLVTVSLGTILAPLNSTMLAVALPEIRGEFSVGHAEIGWLVSAYLIAMAVAQPAGGRLGDQLGRARVFRAGLAAFLVLSIGAAASPNFSTLIFLRTGQALVGAAVIPNGMAMLRESVPVRQLGRSGGITGSVMATSAAAGPLLGAALLAAGSWRWLFLMNVPVVLLGLGAQAVLRYEDAPSRGRATIDWAGGLALAALLVAVTFLLNSLRGGQDVYLLGGAVVTAALLGALFVQRQMSTATPLAEWRLFRNRTYSAATAYILLSNLVMYTTLLAIPFFIKEVQEKGNAATGLLLGSMSVLMAVTAPVSGRISDAAGRRLPALAGSLLAVAAVALLLVGLERDVSFGFLAVTLSLLGLGLGLSFSAASTAAVESAPRELAGTAAGTNSFMRYLGSIVGAGILGAILNTDGGVPEVGLFRAMFAILLVMAAAAAVAASLIHRFPPEVEEAEPEAAPAAIGPSRTVPASRP